MNDQKLAGVLVEWRRNPLRFVVEAIGVNPTNQQGMALKELGRMYEAKMRRSAGGDLSDSQKALSNKIGISIRSGHGTGKDAFLAWVYIWLLTCFPGARGLVTAPTQHQLHDVLWSEMRKWVRKSVAQLHQYIEVQSEKAYRKDKVSDSFVVNRTARVTGSPEEQAETLAGMHGDYMVLAVDEASGVEDGVFRPLMGAMTGKFNMAIMISNPTRNTGFFYQSHNVDRKHWVSMHWSCEDSDMDLALGNKAMSAYVERTRDKYGADSNFYRMRVQGEFPRAEPDALIPLDLIEAAVERNIVEDPRMGLVLGVDVAWQGDDQSVLLFRRGMVVEKILAYRNVEPRMLANMVAGAISEMKVAMTYVDSIGIGAGVVSMLRELRRGVQAVNVSESAPSKDRFVRLRDELWWRVRERFESRMIKIPKDDELIGELAGIKFKRETNGKIKVESKEDMRKRGLASPNKADALMMTMVFSDSAFRPVGIDKYAEPDPFEVRGTGWMSG